jgi:putative drug exporter of the RND superfamily
MIPATFVGPRPLILTYSDTLRILHTVSRLPRHAKPTPPPTERALRHLARGVIRRRKGIVVLAGLFIVVAAALGGNVASSLSRGGFDAPSEQSVHAANDLAAQFHDGSDNILILVHATAGTVDSRAVVAAGTALTQQLAAQPGMANVMSYWSLQSPALLRTANLQDALIVGRITGTQNQVSRREPQIADALSKTHGAITFAVGGFGPAFHEVDTVVEHDLVHAEEFAIPLTLLLLLFVFGSLIAATMPLIIGALAVVGTLLELRILNGITPVSIYAVNLATVLGLGLAIDYSLFVVNRFREELLAGRDTAAALEETMAQAGRTVAGSALTMAAAAGALLVFPLVFLRSFAYSGIAVVLLAGAAALVVLPAVLALLGPRVNALTVWRRSVRPPDAGFWFKMARRVMRRPVLVIVAAAVILAIMAAPFVHIRLGYLDDRVLGPSDQIRQVDDMVRADFGQGQTDALQVVVPHVGSATTAQQAAYAVRLSNLPDVQSVDSSSGIYVKGTALAGPPSYLAQFSNGTGIWYSVVPKGNGLSPAGENLVAAIRDGPAPFTILVGGTPASLVDSTSIISHYLPLAVLLVVGATFLILLFLFRTLFIPVKALVLSVISLSATFGVMVWVFQEGHLSRWLDFTPTGTLIDTMPILMFCVAFGLSMDYEVFLISRMKEFHDNGADNDAAIAGGMQQTGRVITAAALLMSIIFLSLTTSSISFMKLFAVGLALAVLMDAFIIRGMLVPAIMKLAGDLNWWAPPFMRKVPPRPAPRYGVPRPTAPGLELHDELTSSP